MSIDVPAWIDGLEPARQAHRQPLIPGSDVEVWHVPMIFADWIQPIGSAPLTWHETYGKTQITGDDGGRSVAEIEIARRLGALGYEAYLVDAFGAMPVEEWKQWTIRLDEMPRWLKRLCRDIRRHMNISRGGELAGLPDVVAWRPNQEEPLFVEYKGLKDKPRAAQEDWMRIALQQKPALASSIVVVQRVKK